MPRVTVVIPVYDAAPHLPETLQSLSNQTLRDFEVICVDDGSRDASAALVADHAERDPRFVLVHQENAGAGSARNAGLTRARGEFVVFLDADDLFHPRLLELTTERLDETDADVCVYNASAFRGDPSSAGTAGAYIRRALVPTPQQFSADDAAESLFQFVTHAAWLRLYRRSFLLEERLRFPVGHIPDDLCFTAEAMAAATAITVLDEPLVLYRIGHSGTMTSRWDAGPLSFEETLDELRRRLNVRGALPKFDRAFRVLCLDTMSHVLRRVRTAAAYELLHGEIQSRLLDKYGLADLDPEQINLPFLRGDLRVLQNESARRSPLHPARRNPRPAFVRRVRQAIQDRLRIRTKLTP